MLSCPWLHLATDPTIQLIEVLNISVVQLVQDLGPAKVLILFFLQFPYLNELLFVFSKTTGKSGIGELLFVFSKTSGKSGIGCAAETFDTSFESSDQWLSGAKSSRA